MVGIIVGKSNEFPIHCSHRGWTQTSISFHEKFSWEKAAENWCSDVAKKAVFSNLNKILLYHQAPLSLDSPGKNTGVGCHFLLQCMTVKSESEVTQSCPTLRNPIDCSPPGSSVHGKYKIVY